MERSEQPQEPHRQPPYEMQESYILTKEKWLELCEHLTVGCTNQKKFLDSLEATHPPAPVPNESLGGLPACPECGSTTFWNNTDDYQTFFCINDDCKWKQQIRSRPNTPAPPNPCTEQGCTDTENCDEICKHQRIYSPAWLKKHDAAIAKQEREKVLKALSLWRIKRMNGMLKKDVWQGWNEETDFIDSLRSNQQEQP